MPSAVNNQRPYFNPHIFIFPIAFMTLWIAFSIQTVALAGQWLGGLTAYENGQNVDLWQAKNFNAYGLPPAGHCATALPTLEGILAAEKAAELAGIDGLLSKKQWNTGKRALQKMNRASAQRNYKKCALIGDNTINGFDLDSRKIYRNNLRDNAKKYKSRRKSGPSQSSYVREFVSVCINGQKLTSIIRKRGGNKKTRRTYCTCAGKATYAKWKRTKFKSKWAASKREIIQIYNVCIKKVSFR